MVFLRQPAVGVERKAPGAGTPFTPPAVTELEPHAGEVFDEMMTVVPSLSGQLPNQEFCGVVIPDSKRLEDTDAVGLKVDDGKLLSVLEKLTLTLQVDKSSSTA